MTLRDLNALKLDEKQRAFYESINDLIEGEWDVFLEHDEEGDFFRICREGDLYTYLDIEIKKGGLIKYYLQAKMGDRWDKPFVKHHEWLDEIEDARDIFKSIHGKLSDVLEKWRNFKDLTM